MNVKAVSKHCWKGSPLREFPSRQLMSNILYLTTVEKPVTNKLNNTELVESFDMDESGEFNDDKKVEIDSKDKEPSAD